MKKLQPGWDWGTEFHYDKEAAESIAEELKEHADPEDVFCVKRAVIVLGNGQIFEGWTIMTNENEVH